MNLLKIFTKWKEISFDWPFDWLCSKRECVKVRNKLFKTFVSERNIWELERQLEKCNKCYLENNANHPKVKETRWNISVEDIIIIQNIKNKKLLTNLKIKV